MADLSASHQVRTIVGLQARQAPAVEFVRQLIADGYVGEVLSTTMIGLSVAGEVIAQPNVYMLNGSNGANLLTVPLGHSLDTMSHVLGEFTFLSAVSAVRRPLIIAEQTREQIRKTAVDQIAVIGTLGSGATASLHIREAVAGGTGFLWEINGTDGTLRITADAALPEIFPLTVAGARGRNEPVELPVPSELKQTWPALAALAGAPAYNVGHAYAASRRISRRGPARCPTSPTQSIAMRSSRPSRCPPHRGNASRRIRIRSIQRKTPPEAR